MLSSSGIYSRPVGMLTDVSEELITFIFRIKNQAKKKTAFSMPSQLLHSVSELAGF
jgi:hypothetical protein